MLHPNNLNDVSNTVSIHELSGYPDTPAPFITTYLGVDKDLVQNLLTNSIAGQRRRAGKRNYQV